MLLGAENILLVGGILLFLSILAGKAGYSFGVPVLLLFIVVGMLCGIDGMGIVFNDYEAVKFVGVVSLSIILFTGGIDTKFSEIKPIIGPGVAMATVGVFLTTIFIALFVYSICGIFGYSVSILQSLLIGAVLSSTDSASVFSILRSKGMGLKQRLRPMLELESGSNDPMAYLMTIILIQAINSGEFSFGSALWLFISQLAIGIVAGLLLGRLAVIITNRINIANYALYPVLLLAFVFFIYSFTDLVKGNGFLAVYIAGLVVGNNKVVHKRSIMNVFDGFTWLFQILLFLALGLFVNPHELLPLLGIGIVVGMFLILVARPLAVFVTLLPFKRFKFNARLYISWVGLRGAVPLIFAIYPMIAGLDDHRFIFNIAFIVTFVSLLVQGTTVESMARWLKVDFLDKKRAFKIDLPEEIKSAISEIEVVDSFLADGSRLMDLTLPDNTLVVMVKRGDSFFVPKGHTRLGVGDRLLVITDNELELKKTYHSLGIEELRK